MKEVFYKGKSYQYKVINLQNARQFQLYENKAIKHSVDENELDVKSIVSLILDAYYRNVKPAAKSTVLR